jgi:hypothetical protein
MPSANFQENKKMGQMGDVPPTASLLRCTGGTRRGAQWRATQLLSTRRVPGVWKLTPSDEFAMNSGECAGQPSEKTTFLVLVCGAKRAG